MDVECLSYIATVVVGGCSLFGLLVIVFIALQAKTMRRQGL